MRVTSDPRSRAEHAQERALALQALGRNDEAFAVRERMVADLAEVDCELALLIEAGLIATAAFDLTRLAWARERLERYRGRLSVATPGQAMLLVTQAFLDAFDTHEPAAALADVAERALASGQLLDYERSQWLTPFFLAVELLCMADRMSPARAALDRAVEDSRHRGSAPRFAFMSGWRCWLLAREGALVDAEADARSCAELALPQGWFEAAPPMLGFVLDVLVDRGELDDAQRLLERSGMAARTADQDLTLNMLVHARARLRAARGDLERARAELAALAGPRPAWPTRWNSYTPLVPGILLAPELAGDPEEERERAAAMLREAHEWGTGRAIGMALRRSGLAECEARGLELLEEAATVLEDSPAPLEHARALTDFGAALRRANRRAAAREPLRRALDIADACGARPLAEQARYELRAAGGRPRRPRVSGVGALTASEQRIATMAAEGLSNPEIAQALFVTKKTVESHLSNAYQKLGIHSRTQLGAALCDKDGE